MSPETPNEPSGKPTPVSPSVSPEASKADSEARKYEITVNDNRGGDAKNPFLNPVVLSAIVGGGFGLLATLLTIVTSDNQLSRMLTQGRGLAKYQVPVGTIMAYGGPIEEDRRRQLDEQGWLVCDGSLVPSGEKYEPLNRLLGRIWGPGNNSDRVGLPNLQGRFLRGIDPTLNGAIDPDNQTRTNWQGRLGPIVGSFQSDSTKRPNTNFSAINSGAHDHAITGPAAKDAAGSTDTAFAIGNNPKDERRTFPKLTVSGGIHPHTINGGGDAETRPKNAYVYYIIKY